MLQSKWASDKIQQELGADFRLDDHKVIVTYLYAFYEEGNEPDISKFIETVPDENVKRLITEIAMTSDEGEVTEEILSDYIKTVKTESDDKSKIQALKEQLKAAEQQSDPLKAAKIAQEILQIQRKLKK